MKFHHYEIGFAAAQALDLSDGAMISQQGRTVTRAIIESLLIERDAWTLRIRDVDYLNPESLRWERKRDRDEYFSSEDFVSLTCMTPKKAAKPASAGQDFFCLSGYGLVAVLTKKTEDPWRRIRWPKKLESRHLRSGPLER